MSLTSLVKAPNQSFTSVEELRLSKGLDPNYSVQLTSYYPGVLGGAGTFYVDASDTTSVDDGGHTIVNSVGQRIKRADQSTLRWEDFGIMPGMPQPPTKAQCESAWAVGISKGIKYYETFLKGEMTLTFPLEFKLPANWSHGEVFFKATGLHKFAYDFTNGATDDVFSAVLRIESLSGTVPVHVEYCFDNEGMGRFPGKNIRYTALRHTRCPSSRIKIMARNNYGYALFLDTCNNSEVYNSSFYNCDGQLTQYSPGGAWDSFGDAIYIASRNVTVRNCYMETTQGGRAGIVYEGTGVPLTGGTVIDCLIIGYDRGVHVESMANRMDPVNIIGGRILNCNTSVLAYHGSTTTYSSDLTVTVKGLVSRREVQISQQGNPSGFTMGHVMSAGHNCTVITEGCSWQQHVNNISVIANGKWISNGDKMFVNSGGINLPYTRGSSITNLDAAQNKNALQSNGDIVIHDSIWGGDINITGGNRSEIRNVEMSNFGGYANCGRISLTGTARKTRIRDVRFQYPLDWAIDNTQTVQIPECPVIENVTIYSTGTGTATLQRNAESGANNRYVRALSSYIANGSTWQIIT